MFIVCLVACSQRHNVFIVCLVECSQRQYREISRGYGGGSSPSESSQNSEEDMETEVLCN